MRQNPIVWQLTFLGGLRASNQDRIIERFRTQKTAALLALLALRGARSREDVCALLWPDATPEASRNSLSAALSALRRDLGDEIVRADRASVSLDPSLFQTDAALFNDAFKAENYARAVELYRGHLLPGFHEDPFPALEREYEEKARTAFKARLEELEENGQSTELLELARRAVTLFGDDERWFLALMRAHYGLGDLDAALRAYDSLGRFMRKSGDTASESARLLAKLIRRDKERESTTPTAPVARRPLEAPLPEPAVSVPVADPSLTASDEPEAPRNNLPTQWTRFFGRENERALLAAWLRDGQKLVTLSGAGGSGKTRLSLETLRELAPEWDGDIVFVPLAPLSDAELLLPAIRDALQLTGTPDLPPLEQIERALRGRHALLFLDNFEQLVEGGAARLQTLRERLPQTTFLVTSRVLLQLPGEREFPVSPLPTPLRNTAPAEVRDCASAALFCDRSGLVIDASNAEAVGALCRRLDGIPLALELAAARAKVLSPAQILERLQKHPDFLQSRELGVPARHKTLRATIEWSTDLLPPDLREFWTRLSLFHGGWTLDAAEKIAAPGICEEWETLDWLTLLRECSLIFTEERGELSRFRMLQTLREFGREQLQDTEEVEHAFFDFYLGLAQQAASAMQGPGQTAWLARLDAEQDNLRAALAYARDAEPERGLLLATALIDFWETRLSLDEGRGWIETFLRATAPPAIEKPASPQKNTPPSASTAPVPSANLEVRTRALSGAGRMASHSIELGESRSLVEQGLDVARQSASTHNFVYAVASFVRFAMTSGEVETDMAKAKELAEEATRMARQTTDKSLLAEALSSLSYIRISLADFHSLRPLYEESIALLRPLQDEARLSRMLSSFAHLCYHENRWDEANALLDESTPIARRLNSPWELLEALWVRSNVARESGHLDVARAAIAEEWEVCRDNPTLLWARCMNMMMIGYLRLREGDPVSAVRVWGAEEVLRETANFQNTPVIRLDYNRYLAEARRILGQTRFDTLWKEGRALPYQQAVDAALYGGDPRDSSSLTAARARAFTSAGRFAWYASDFDNAQTLLSQGLDAARRSGDSSVLIDATRSSALATTAFGEANHARELGRESVLLARQSGDDELLLKSLVDLGFAEINVSDFLASEAVCREAITLARRLGHQRSLALALTTLAIAYNYLHRYEEARALLEESRPLSRRLGAMWELMVSAALSGHVASVQGRHEEAREAYREAIPITRQFISESWTVVNMLLSVAYSFFRRGDARGCTRLMGACEALAQSINYELMPFLLPDYNHFREAARQALGDAEFEREWQVGRLWTPDQTMDFALSEESEEVATPGDGLATRARALSAAGRLAWHDNDFASSRQLVEQGLEAARKSGDTASYVHAIAAFVRLSTVSGESDLRRGRVLAEEAIHLSRQARDASLLTESLISLSYAVMSLGEFTGLREVLAEAIDLARKSGDELQLATAQVSLATLAYHENRYAQARELLAHSIATSRQLNSPFILFATLWCESHVARALDDLDASQRAIVESLEMCRSSSAFRWSISNLLLSASYLLIQRGDVEGGVQLMSAAHSLASRSGYQIMPLLRLDSERYRALARQLLDEAAFTRAWEEGQTQTFSGALDLAFERLTRTATADPLLAARARALSGAGRLAWYASDMGKANELLRQGMDASRSIGDTAGIVYATRGLMRTSATSGDSATARQLAGESLALARSSGETSLLIKSLLDQAFADINIGDLNSALALSSEATELARQSGDEASLPLALNIGAISLSHNGRDEESLELIRQSEAIARRIGSQWDLLVLLANKGHSYSRLEQHVAAQQAFNECLSLCRESFAEAWTVANTLFATSYSFMRRGEVRDGTQIMGAAEAMRDRIGYMLMPIMLPDYEQFTTLARQTLGEAEFEAAKKRGAAMTPGEVFDFAIRPLLPNTAPPSGGSNGAADHILAARSRALSGAGRLAWHDSDLQASRALVEQGLEAARKSGDLPSFVRSVAAYVRFAMVTEESAGFIVRSRVLAEEAVARSRSAGDSVSLLDSLISLGYATCVLAQMEESFAVNEEAIALARGLGDDANLTRALTIQVGVYYHLKTPAPALALVEECVALSRRINSPWDLIAAQWLHSGIARLQGHLDESYAAIAEVLELCRANPNYKWNVSHVFMMASYLFVERGELTKATQLMAASQALSASLGYRPTPNLLPEFERYKAKALELLGQTAFNAAWQQGSGLAPEAAIELALHRDEPASSREPDEVLAARSRALSGAGRLAWHGSDLEASRLLVTQGLEAARESGDTASFVYAVAAFVRFAMVTGDLKGVIAQSRFLSEEAVARSRRSGDNALLLDSLISLGYANTIVSQFREASIANEEAIALARELGDETNLVRSLNNQASVYYHQGIYPPARIILEESEEHCRRLNSTWDLIAARWTLSSVAREQGDLGLADEAISEVLEICRANPSFRWGVSNVLMTMSYLFVKRDDPINAVRLMAASEAISELLGYHPVPVLLAEYERYKAQARDMLDETTFAEAWEEGRVLSTEAAIELALKR